jgi:hypothetical protein
MSRFNSFVVSRNLYKHPFRQRVSMTWLMPMKRKAPLTAFILAFLVSTVALLSSSSFGSANPVPIMPPTSPGTEPPVITVQAPSDTAYYSESVQLNFTVIGCDHGLVSPYDNPDFLPFIFS